MGVRRVACTQWRVSACVVCERNLYAKGRQTCRVRDGADRPQVGRVHREEEENQGQHLYHPGAVDFVFATIFSQVNPTNEKLILCESILKKPKNE